MKKIALLSVVLILIQSCIPLRIAPRISDYKITKGKRFKRGLPKSQLFIFEDHKDANEFYNYINTKFKLNHGSVTDNVLFVINDEQFYFSFYEVEIKDKQIDLLGATAAVVVNKTLSRSGEYTSYFNDDTQLREQGNYYIAIDTHSTTEKDCLAKNSLSRPLVLEYLRNLKNEYLVTHNYNEILFKN